MIRFILNGRPVTVVADPAARLSDILRDSFGLTGTKIGCNAGDCGACTILLDGNQVCACLTSAGRAEGATIRTVEDLDGAGLNHLQRAFRRHAAAQCGICTPGMLMAAHDLLARDPTPTDAAIEAALAGVLCRCTGYRPIIDAIRDVAGEDTQIDGAVGARHPHARVSEKLAGRARYGADALPDGTFLTLRALRSPHPHASFTIGDLTPLKNQHPTLLILTAADLPAARTFGIYPTGKDQPVLADGIVRHLGEPVLALVADATTLACIADTDIPITWHPLPQATLAGGPQLHPHAPDNILIRGRVARGDPNTAHHAAADITITTGFVEHAYIEPEAGYAEPDGTGGVIVHATTQTPYMDRDELALILGLPPERVRVIPTEVGGGFGGKLDLSVQPLIAIAALRTNRPVRWVWTRAESMRASTKRHPAIITMRATASQDGSLVGIRFHGDYDTGAYASWGPTVATRVPVHASGPYRVPNLLATTAAIHTNGPPSGAFRGFGVPQAAIAGETLMDALADQLGIDRLAFRRQNALRPGDPTATGQVLGQGAALPECLDALAPHWTRLRAEAAAHNATATTTRRGVGVACMWYGIGNTSLSNPSTIDIGVTASGEIVLFTGALDIGQGADTILRQIAAETLAVPPETIRLVTGDTARTPDAGKTSASRQTFVSGNATRLAAESLREKLRAPIPNTPPDAEGIVLRASGHYDPPTTPLDADGQGEPYASYAFGAQLAAVEVDLALGTVKLLRIVAAHDVGRAINPTLVEGQITGGIAQGIGLALMEEYLPGRTDNLHDYLIPTIGDVPPIDCILIETTDPLGPYGAKGVGEPALIATAPAILNAIADATGARLTQIPATPDRVLAALGAPR